MNTRTWVQVLGKAVAWLGAAGSIALLTGCACLCQKAKPQAVMTARYTAVPVTVDGDLNDPAWKDAQVYPLSFSVAEKATLGTEVTEAGEARICWDDKYFYLGVKFFDSDIVAEGKDDQLHHYQMGDVAELFLKPAGKTWYWEMYVTPAGRRTTLWFPGRGRLGLKSCEDNPGNLRVAALCHGTLNNWEDKDSFWTGEMAVPVEELRKGGEPFGAGARWTIMVSRYNYSRYLSNKELSMAPRLSQTNYHLLEDYAILNLVK